MTIRVLAAVLVLFFGTDLLRILGEQSLESWVNRMRGVTPPDSPASWGDLSQIGFNFVLIGLGLIVARSTRLTPKGATLAWILGGFSGFGLISTTFLTVSMGIPRSDNPTAILIQSQSGIALLENLFPAVIGIWLILCLRRRGASEKKDPTGPG